MTTLTERQLESLSLYGFDPLLFENWQKSVNQGWLNTQNNWIQGDILAPEAGSIQQLPKRDSEEWDRLRELGGEAIGRGEFGIVLLNGGMATRFGGAVKGVVDVLGKGRSFLGLAMQDVRRMQDEFGGTIHVYLMNSFATDEATKEHFFENAFFHLDPDQIHHFTQFISVRMKKDGDVFVTESGDISPHGPGHGDFAPAFRHSGCLRQFIGAGGRWVFVHNIDNLGARISPVVLGQHIASNAEVTVEVAPKWPEDIGGSPFLVDGKVQLVEQIRYPPKFNPDIVDVFNTNTFTFTAEALDRDFDLGWYFVEKEVDGSPAVQIERLIGEMTKFLTTNFVQVRRHGKDNRFFPVKTPEDLEAGREEIIEIYDG